MIDHIRISQQARDQLLKLKRATGLKNWNVLCRWALCKSLAEPSVPSPAKIPADSSVEMTWRVFAGDHEELYWAIIKARCLRDGLGLDEETIGMQFRLHLHRGIGYLAAARRGTLVDFFGDGDQWRIAESTVKVDTQTHGPTTRQPNRKS